LGLLFGGFGWLDLSYLADSECPNLTGHCRHPTDKNNINSPKFPVKYFFAAGGGDIQNKLLGNALQYFENSPIAIGGLLKDG